MATTNTLEPIQIQNPIGAQPDAGQQTALHEFRAARISDDLAELFTTVEREDNCRAATARHLDLIHQAQALNRDLAQLRSEILLDAAAELRSFMSNLAATLDAAAERDAELTLELQEAGVAFGGTGRLDVTASGDDLARALLGRLAAPQT